MPHPVAMASIVDEYLDSPMDSDDVFPCKGCGEVSVFVPWDSPMPSPGPVAWTFTADTETIL